MILDRKKKKIVEEIDSLLIPYLEKLYMNTNVVYVNDENSVLYELRASTFGMLCFTKNVNGISDFERWGDLRSEYNVFDLLRILSALKNYEFYFMKNQMKIKPKEAYFN